MGQRGDLKEHRRRAIFFLTAKTNTFLGLQRLAGNSGNKIERGEIFGKTH
jgi:hypothetical protein